MSQETKSQAHQAVEWLVNALLESNDAHLKPIAADTCKQATVGAARIIIADLNALPAARAKVVELEATIKALREAAKTDLVLQARADRTAPTEG